VADLEPGQRVRARYLDGTVVEGVTRTITGGITDGAMFVGEDVSAMLRYPDGSASPFLRHVEDAAVTA
jgi:hypothetical protein